jgi:Ring finger domain
MNLKTKFTIFTFCFLFISGILIAIIQIYNDNVINNHVLGIILMSEGSLVLLFCLFLCIICSKNQENNSLEKKKFYQEKEEICFCLVPMKQDDLYYDLKCGHIFHFSCFDSWLISQTKNKKICPLCRGEISYSTFK